MVASQVPAVWAVPGQPTYESPVFPTSSLPQSYIYVKLNHFTYQYGSFLVKLTYAESPDEVQFKYFKPCNTENFRFNITNLAYENLRKNFMLFAESNPQFYETWPLIYITQKNTTKKKKGNEQREGRRKEREGGKTKERSFFSLNVSVVNQGAGVLVFYLHRNHKLF